MNIDYDESMDRFYIPVNSHYEIQTKGKGSSFRIANIKTGKRWHVTDERLHKVLEDLARTSNAELGQLRAKVAELDNENQKLRQLITLTGG